ncbi:MAG TPA: putative baseplate assembly protein, partial [Longimicrobium sp.]|nr:putative baseplate assembly protein [Longimicrobium sp.]
PAAEPAKAAPSTVEVVVTVAPATVVPTGAVIGILDTVADSLRNSTSKVESVRASAQAASLVVADEANRLHQLGGTMTAAEVEEVRDTLRDLRGGFSELSTAARDLGEAAAQLSALAGSASPPGTAAMGNTGAGDVPPASVATGSADVEKIIAPGSLALDPTDLRNLLGGDRLELGPSRPPASARDLGRDAATALAVGSIAAPELVSALNPRLGRALYGAWGAARVPRSKTVPRSVFAFRVRTSPFGATAIPERPVMDDGVVVDYQPWELAEPETEQLTGPQGAKTRALRTVSLDAVHDRILPGSWVGLRRAGNPDIHFFRVEEAETLARADYGISARVTRLTLDRPWHTLSAPSDSVKAAPIGIGILRETTVLAQAEELALADEPVMDAVEGAEIPLDGLYPGLLSGRWIIVSGQRVDLPGVPAAELAMISGVRHGPPEVSIHGAAATPIPGARVITYITLAQPLAYAYLRETVVIHGNVARATHGETRSQVLGSGDGSAALQRFALQQSPLTYVAADTASGIESTLTVRIEGVRWDAAPHLAALGPESRGYLVRTDHEGVTSVTFGDGVRGSRLPTGRENVTAVYRTGIGAPGNVAASQISLLATRPQGLKGVVNPLPASGGGDPDTAEQIRRNAPLGLVSLQRVVSLEDYVDFARSFAGVGKAHAAFLADGRRRVVHLTIAGVDDAPVPEGSELHTALVAALRRYGDPHRWLMVAHRELRTLLVSARVMVRDDVLWENVEPVARAALLSAFGFDRRELGQPVAASEVVSVLQGVRGVQAVDLDLLAAIGERELRQRPDILSWLDLKNPVPACLASGLARAGQPKKDGGGRLPSSPPEPAQLLLLSPEVPDTLILTEWKR